MNLKDSHKSRSVTEVGPGDYVKVRGEWKEIESNPAQGDLPRTWSVKTTDGAWHGMYNIDRYAKAEDMEIKEQE